MQCEHTGCVVYSSEYGCYFRGDLYLTSTGCWLLKSVAQRFYEPPQPHYHMTVHEIEALWDNLSPYWVIVIGLATYHGREGRKASEDRG